MAQNTNISQLDAAQVFKRTVDGEHDAIRVVQALNTEMQIELSAEDGDSIQSVARTRLIKAEDGEVDCSDLRRICFYGNTDAHVELSPDGKSWFKMHVLELQVKEICAMKLKISQGMLVGQS
jgi:hypothetical protein